MHEESSEMREIAKSDSKEIGLRTLVLFGLLNTLPFPLSILFDIFANTLGALSQVLPLGFDLPPMFGFLDSILRGNVIDWVITPIAEIIGVPEQSAYFGCESPQMLLWFGLTLAVAFLGALIWKRLFPVPKYDSLRRWSHLWFRWFLASMMLRYGAMKVYDTQFGEPLAEQLITPAGELSRQQLLWMVFGASPTFECFAGAMEMIGALLILHRRTALSGLLLLLGVLSQVVSLNWLCGINVKFVSGFLLLVNLTLLIPYWPRIRGFFAGRLPVPDEGLSVVDLSKRPERLRRFGWILALSYLAAFHLTALRQRQFTQERFPKRWMHGVWEVQELVKNDVALSKPELEHWRTFTFDHYARFSATTRGGEQRKWMYSHDDASASLSLRPMGAPSSDTKDVPAWQDFTLRQVDESPSARHDEPESMELTGSIGPDQYRIRAKRLRYKLLGEL